MRELPITGAASNVGLRLVAGPEATAGFIAVAVSLADAMAHCNADKLTVRPLPNMPGFQRGWETVHDLGHLFERCTAPAAVANQAAAQLGAALAHPSYGPRVLRDFFCAISLTPVFEHMCRALTAESRLRNLELCLDRPAVPAASAVLALAAAIADERARLETLKLVGTDLIDGGGCVVCCCAHHVGCEPHELFTLRRCMAK